LEELKRISIIGSGNVATHLSIALYKSNYNIDTIFSLKKSNAELLANQVNSFAINEINQIDNTSDIYIVCIKDDAINSFLKTFPFKDKLVVHTSGSVSIDVFKQNGFSNYGIFYPLQTFSKDKDVYMDEVPFCIEGCNPEIEKQLITLAEDISDKVYEVNSEQRKTLHVAAVFACNFSNYMYHVANDITTKNNIDFDILKPLILETAKKIKNNSPLSMQTGPAKRKDDAVIQQHIKMLSNTKDYQEIYQLITKSIIDNS